MNKPVTAPSNLWDDPRFQRRLSKRYAAEKRFRLCGIAAIALALICLLVLLTAIVGNGTGALRQTYMAIDVYFDPARIDPKRTGDPEIIRQGDFGGVVKAAMRKAFPQVEGRRSKRRLYKLVSPGAAFQLGDMVREQPSLIGQTRTVWVPADDDVDMLMKGIMDRRLPENERRLNDKSIAWIDELVEAGRIEKRFNRAFFESGDSREPELAGIRGALTGSFYTLVVTLVLSFPVGVGAAIYLEELAPKNRLTDLIEVNINNLAAVPSIVFGLLGLAVFLNFFHLPRSAPVVGALVLTLMTLPTIIIAARAALKSVPPSIREAALSVGASPMQTVIQHVLPLAMPGVLTGTIIGMARALGETAPLLMIGMVAFVVDIPAHPLDKSTVLPVQVFLWADSPERAFEERTAAATLVLLVFLIVMNAAAVLLRQRFEKRW
ncbi:MAG: phosphate ABC transporter permease PstA [Gammaproteobacteria bacterium]|nr:phosphate ABC transporter permease PstA [Gammaproteobacteria bacterium]